MKLKIKKLHPNAVMPSRAYPCDAGLDLTACAVKGIGSIYREGDKEEVSPARVEMGFGLAVAIPAGYVGLIFPRSSCHKTAMRLSNCVGVIDSGYRGELKAVFDVLIDRWDEGNRLAVPIDRPCAQLVILPLPEVELEEVDELSPSERGTGGFGSSDERRTTHGE